MTDSPSIPAQGSGTVGGPGQPATQPTPQPDNTADLTKELNHWKGVATGAQSFINTLKKERDELLASSIGLSTQVQEVTSKLTAAEQLASEAATTKEAHEQSQKKLELLNLLMDPKYQPLQNWYSKGILRTDGLSGEELVKYMDAAVGEVPQPAPSDPQKPRAQGVTPSAPPGQSVGGITFAQVKEEMAALLNQGKASSTRFGELKVIHAQMIKAGEHLK